MSVPVDEQASTAELWRLSDAELRDEVVDLEHRIRLLQARSLQVVSELESRGRTFGYPNLARFLTDSLRVSSAEAKTRIRHATALIPARTATGASLPPPLPATGQAMAEGELSTGHVDQVYRTVRELPEWVGPEQRDSVERQLVDAARQLDPSRVSRVGRRVLAHLDQDGRPPRDDDLAQPHNELRLTTKRDGRIAFTGELDAVSGAQFTALLSPLAKPRPAQDGQYDPRAAHERQGDALVELLELLGRGDALPIEAGERPHILVQLSEESLRSRTGIATLGAELPVPVERIRHLACDAKVIPVVLDSAGLPLDVGRAYRTAPPHLRHALTVRDGGCAFPGCDRPPRWTQAHHIQEWRDLGETKLDNMVLLCGAHHRLLHHSPWEVRIGPDGHADFLPPAVIDPARTPRRNTGAVAEPHLV